MLLPRVVLWIWGGLRVHSSSSKAGSGSSSPAISPRMCHCNACTRGSGLPSLLIFSPSIVQSHALSHRAASFSQNLTWPSAWWQGILFIWPDERGWEKALATPPPLPPNTDGPEWKQRWSMRDLPYGYEMLAENVVDVSHLPFAHHGVGSLKRDSGKPLPLQLTSMVTSPPQPPPLADT